MSGVTQSNRDYIVSKTGQINGSIKSASIFGGVTKSSFGSSAKCPSLEPSLVETFLGCCKEVLRRTSEDIANVAKIGEGFATLDNVMANKATTLNMEVKSYMRESGMVALTESGGIDVPSNSEVRKEIEAILAEKGADFHLDDRSGSNDDDEPSGNYNWSGYTGTSGSPSISEVTTTPTPVTEAVTEAQTEAVIPETEPETERITEATEPETEALEPVTEVKTQPQTQPSTQPPVVEITQPTTKPEKPKPVKVSSSSDDSGYIEITTVPEVSTVADIIAEDEPYIVEDIIEEEPEVVLPDTIEEPIIEEEIVLDEEPIMIDETPVPKKSGSGIGTAAAIIGAGVAIGGAGYAANKYLQKKQEDGDEGYEEDGEGDYA